MHAQLLLEAIPAVNINNLKHFNEIKRIRKGKGSFKAATCIEMLKYGLRLHIIVGTSAQSLRSEIEEGSHKVG